MPRALVVTGGTRGVGRAVAQRLADPGDSVFLGYWHDKDAAEAVGAQVGAKGADVTLIQADVMSTDFAPCFTQHLETCVLPLEVVVHCAIAPRPVDILNVAPEDFEALVRANGLSFITLVQALHPFMPPTSSAFFISSSGSERAIPDYAGIGAPKALAEAGVRYLAAALAPRRVRVNTVLAGAMESESFRQAFSDADTVLRRAQRQAMLGRLVTAEDVASMIEYLASSDAQMVTGARITVDAGAALF